MLFQKLVIISDPYVPETKEHPHLENNYIIKVHHSTESFHNLWLKEVTLPEETELVENQFTELNLLTKTSKRNI